ncbi:MAG: pyruvate formate lyase family protein [Bacteroidales bacterium]|nr:pyruvate formate lyase family protein [Bacteroidales bacterium]
MERRNFIKVSLMGATLFVAGSFEACKFKGPAASASKIKNRNSIEFNNNDLVAYLKEFTDAHKQHAGDYYGRELACNRIQLKGMLCKLRDEDILVGRNCFPPVGFSPQAGERYLYYCQFKDMEKLREAADLTPENKSALNNIISYWKEEDGVIKTRKAYKDDIASVLTSDKWSDESGIGFPLYRISGTQLDYDKLITLGIPGLTELIQEKQLASAGDQEKSQLYSAMLNMLNILKEAIDLYSVQVNEAIDKTKDSARKKQLVQLGAALKHIKSNAPETLYQGVQLMYLYSVLTGSVNYGRMDEYLGDLYIRDKAKGVTDEEQIAILQGLWHLVEARDFIFDSRVIVGGKGRRNEQNADQIASLIMESVFRSRLVVPQLTLRFYEGQNPALYAQGLDMIGQSYPYPMLYNDDVNVPAVMNAFRVSEKEAEQYLPFGCGEYILYHKSIGTPSGVINMLQALLVTLNNGVDPTTGKPQGLALGTDFTSYEELFAAYKKQIEYYVDALAKQEKLEYDVAGETAPFLLMSMLFDDCIDRGKPLLKGGLNHLGGSLESYGNSNTGDALTSIKYWVYDKKEYTLDEVRKALTANFDGYEEMQKKFLNAPKYGNDDAYADDIMVAADNHLFAYTRNSADKVGLNSYLIVVINNHANTLMGRYTMASPDGRLANTYMANGNAPTGGADHNGVTAMLNSIVKPDASIHAGSVQNMKFSKEMFSKELRPKLEALLDTYWKIGGTQAMLNVLGKDDLVNALKEPEKYQNLIVRVGGFSARFVDLAPDVQQEIISRTLY